MAESNTAIFLDDVNIKISDICGLWEVIRITKEDDENPLYQWLSGRFQFYFMPEMIFLCMKNRQYSHGTWELFEKASETKKQFSIILNGTIEYTIVGIDEDEILLSDRNCKYFLTRKL